VWVPKPAINDPQVRRDGERVPSASETTGGRRKRREQVARRSDYTTVSRGTMTPGQTLLMWALGGFVLVGTGALGVYVWYQRTAGEREQSQAAVEGNAVADGDTATGAATQEADVSPASEPLTDEEQVLELLDDNGGRLWQTAIYEETDWSKAKVSRVLSRMEQHEQVSKIAIGRENIITLPGEEPEIARQSR
jgi:hypothetical protein